MDRQKYRLSTQPNVMKINELLYVYVIYCE